MRTMIWLVAAGLVASTAGGAAAQDRGRGHANHAAHSGASADNAATREFKAAHARMMRNMAMPFTGDPDVDLRMHMIPHHQGAIDMARVALRHAKDPRTRRDAEAIIVAQQQNLRISELVGTPRGDGPSRWAATLYRRCELIS